MEKTDDVLHVVGGKPLNGTIKVRGAKNFVSKAMVAALLAPVLGLRGVWIAMCAELCFRGAIFLLRLWRGNWLRPVRSVVATNR